MDADCCERTVFHRQVLNKELEVLLARQALASVQILVHLYSDESTLFPFDPGCVFERVLLGSGRVTASLFPCASPMTEVQLLPCIALCVRQVFHLPSFINVWVLSPESHRSWCLWPHFVGLYGNLQDHEGCTMNKKLSIYCGFWFSKKQAYH